MPLVTGPNEPMLTDDGQVVEPLFRPSSPSTRFDEIPSNKAMQRHAVAVRRQLADMPLPPKQMNLVSLICMYTLMGLTDLDISVALALPIERVENIKTIDAYQTVYDAVVDSIISEEVADVRTFLVSKSKNAAETVVSVMENSEFDAVKLMAAKDVLDRSGNRPADIIEHHHHLDGDLRISITREDNIKDIEVPLERIIDAEGVQSS